MRQPRFFGGFRAGLSLVATAALLLFVPSQAHGQKKPGAADSLGTLADQLEGKDLADYKVGRALFDQGDNERAYEKFAEIHERTHNARLLWNMAACQKNLQRYEQAERLLRRYLADAEGTLSKESTARAEAILETLAALLGTLVVEAPPDVRIVIDGREVAAKERAGIRLRIGDHRLVASQNAHLDRVEEFHLQAKEIKRILVTLPVAPARLVVVAERNAAILLDGHAVATSYFDGKVAPGAHLVRVAAKGKKAFSTTVELEAGGSRNLNVGLEDEPATGIPGWVWGVGGTALAAGLVVGGYFVLRTEDRQVSPSGTLPPNAIQLP
jgi:tetratricopeptide (TPR) repeat protein